MTIISHIEAMARLHGLHEATGSLAEYAPEF